MGEPKILFVDHSFHKKTESTKFVTSTLQKHFEVDIFWDDTWWGGKGPSVDLTNTYARVFFLQSILPLWQLRKITAKIIWAPMYDGVSLRDIYWSSLSRLPVRVVSFSDVIYKKCKTFGIEVLPLQYYLPPNFRNAESAKKLNFLFWYRGGIKFSDLKRILDTKDVNRLVYRSAPDPFFKEEVISEADIKKYKMEIVRNSEADSREDYLRLLDAADVFIAPRKKEGIGMSFLEAMAMGKVVVAYNEGTMNEYIQDGRNGYLFDAKRRYIDFSHFADVLRNSKISVSDGWKRWEQDKNKMIDFIAETGSEKSKKITMEFLLCSFLQFLKGKLVWIKKL